MKKIKCWVEAMRLRTLPVSLAGVILAIGFAIAHGEYEMTPAWLCLLFALLAQIASNFANEYYDFKSGLDKKGRVGPRRGVTEGDITPQAMKIATYITLGVACFVGCLLINWSGWWLIGVGVLIAIGVIAYSSGPYPLSRHGLGEVAVLFFFGVIPVNFTYYLMTQDWASDVLFGSIAAGLMGANVLLVNNYRDYEDDKAVNKQTLAVKLGRKSAPRIYTLNGVLAVIIFMHNPWLAMPRWTLVFPIIYLLIHSILSIKITQKKGSELNPFLGMTAMAMLYYSLSFTLLQL